MVPFTVGKQLLIETASSPPKAALTKEHHVTQACPLAGTLRDGPNNHDAEQK